MRLCPHGQTRLNSLRTSLLNDVAQNNHSVSAARTELMALDLLDTDPPESQLINLMESDRSCLENNASKAWNKVGRLTERGICLVRIPLFTGGDNSFQGHFAHRAK